MKIVAISGSLRGASLNTFLLQSVEKLLPTGVSYDWGSIADIPLYNEDLDGPVKPASVTALSTVVENADGLLIATPEYNYSIPGGLKNALDWLSRPAFKSVLAGKPVAIMSASKAPTGGVRAQGQLKQVLAGVLTATYAAPEFMVPSAHQAFSEDGVLIDEAVRTRLTRFITDYCTWVKLGLGESQPG